MDANNTKKENIYRRIRIGGLLSFIPFVLAAGPMAGYFLGDYLEKRFHLPPYIAFICIAVGIAASTMETIKIVKTALRSMDNK